jgi:hypothetical protein
LEARSGSGKIEVLNVEIIRTSIHLPYLRGKRKSIFEGPLLFNCNKQPGKKKLDKKFGCNKKTTIFTFYNLPS